ncbi:cbb3-type cytochrome oxidase assembly protein CcoS [Paenimyroides tangerinum]|uniref:Cbb3-type cytochrome oxidase assembly protein CcoS n=1 Tax=Paenimyroides tangerinum TaxID=2488728 RepID=A0A3P3WF12_9FLAO|nr:cbb3-type cytochrome oxidase assembly protein CcoS [Paenimyroides tangerinum]RRJ92626.1 cbb3-type cytochrome oxidase assembly protein CcoS [Paenimyroides tangerinum]
MGVIYILICISIFVAAVFLFLFIKSVKSGQFDDDYTPSVRMLFEDELKSKTDSKIISNTDKNKNNSN